MRVRWGRIVAVAVAVGLTVLAVRNLPLIRDAAERITAFALSTGEEVREFVSGLLADDRLVAALALAAALFGPLVLVLAVQSFRRGRPS